MNGPVLSNLRVGNGTTRFWGDSRFLTTVSPDADGFRDAAVVRFSLDRSARVTMLVYLAWRGLDELVGCRIVRLSAGNHSITWTPTKKLPEGSYVIRLVAVGASGHRSTYGWTGPHSTEYPRGPVVHIQHIEAITGSESYRPGQLARVTVSTDAHALSMTILHVGAESTPPWSDYDKSHMYGVPVTQPQTISWAGRRSKPYPIYLRVGPWPSGLYAVELSSPDGRLGYAPFIVRASEPSADVLVVLPTDTWQVYNYRDTNGDGWPDTWYADWARDTVSLTRPYLRDGVPFNYRNDLGGFIRWLYTTGHRPDFTSDRALETTPLSRLLHYAAVVFPDHTEYVTTREYDLVTAYRNHGGNLAFLSADNMFRRVDRVGHTLKLVGLWRNLGRPEAALLGVQYDGCCNGVLRPYTVTTTSTRTPWLLANTGLAHGSRFGKFGVEADAIAATSPRTTRELAVIPNLMGPGRPAQLTTYTTHNGSRVFSAGVVDFGGSASENPTVAALLRNLWTWISHG